MILYSNFLTTYINTLWVISSILMFTIIQILVNLNFLFLRINIFIITFLEIKSSNIYTSDRDMIITFVSLLRRTSIRFLIIFIRVFGLIIIYSLFVNRTFLSFKRFEFIIIEILLIRVINYYYIRLSQFSKNTYYNYGERLKRSYINNLIIF